MWRNIQGWQLLIIVLAIIILFGWKRLPDASRSLGRSLRIFKSEVDTMRGDDDKPSAASRDTVAGTAGEARSEFREGWRAEGEEPGGATAAEEPTGREPTGSGRPATGDDFPRRDERDAGSA